MEDAESSQCNNNILDKFGEGLQLGIDSNSELYSRLLEEDRPQDFAARTLASFHPAFGHQGQ